MSDQGNRIEDMTALGILKPGEILVVEAQAPLSAQRYNDLKASFEAASKDLGVKILLLPYGIRAARVSKQE